MQIVRCKMNFQNKYVNEIKVPVLFLIFNRPDLTRKVFSRIRDYKPSQLFIACDGPRPQNDADIISCAQSRQVVDLINWNCDVKTLFREQNLGCKRAVESAISWFFNHVSEGIILEDDCLPQDSFFPFCSELLSAHRDNRNIAIISGFNPLRDVASTNRYRYSIYAGIWGWATWKRVWENYDPDFSDLDSFLNSDLFKKLLKTKEEMDYWSRMFRSAYLENANSWAYPWLLSWWKGNCIGIIPETNLISNIGFGANATHTTTETPFFSNNCGQMTFPLSPVDSKNDINFDRRYAHQIYLCTLKPQRNNFLNKFKKLFFKR